MRPKAFHAKSRHLLRGIYDRRSTFRHPGLSSGKRCPFAINKLCSLIPGIALRINGFIGRFSHLTPTPLSILISVKMKWGGGFPSVSYPYQTHPPVDPRRIRFIGALNRHQLAQTRRSLQAQAPKHRVPCTSVQFDMEGWVGFAKRALSDLHRNLLPCRPKSCV